MIGELPMAVTMWWDLSYRLVMVATPDVLVPRWRRLDAAMKRVRAASPTSETETPDAVVAVLHTMYDLWEVLRREIGKAKRVQCAAKGEGGQTAVALTFARGAVTHDLVEFAKNAGFGLQPFGASSFGGGWYWRAHEDIRPNYKVKSDWYRDRVKGRAVLEPLEAAYRWYRDRKEISRP
ncbi:hypothetical protein [Geodermatophilus obscurus]|uniref:Uncharacterized protein n=1 Tax=Geodermatophilus obscurus (strain ATCC 25078 / DSM 43160 / JCM 3152 / CCUG 61914 / KCC A-0152 / KCTC 9177 / NBRC 13315 / NRRL B-3577 / G-20) TaxID=526225 RepID=D2S888_GEOOG|nr:hypothetical protein [Geodermatophilus obscurus]ADB73510.1 hypothetical protein Gobs_0740 [Geodermatophilus obscurus DSM 43160]